MNTNFKWKPMFNVQRILKKYFGTVADSETCKKMYVPVGVISANKHANYLQQK